MQKIVSVITIFVIFILPYIFPFSYASAHLGNGPPFLSVNGIYAQTNNFYQGQITLNIPLDLVDKNFLINQPITLAVDLNKLQQQTFTPPGFLNNVSFRWSYATGDNFDQNDGEYQYGTQTTYTFSRAQSYLITLEGKSPIDQGYVILDTVQVNILPYQGYQMPKNFIYFGQKSNTNVSYLFVAHPTVDPSISTVHYLWDFNGGKVESGKSIMHDFSQDFTQKGLGLVFGRIIDDRGFVTDIGFRVDQVNNKPQFNSFSNIKESVFKQVSYEQALSYETNKTNTTTSISTTHPFPLKGIVISFIVLAATGVIIRVIRTSKSDSQ